MAWYHMPIEDDGVPDESFERQWERMSEQLIQMLEQGKVALHCMGGSGRTGILADRFLRQKGWSLARSIAAIRQQRPKAFSNATQLEYIQKF